MNKVIIINLGGTAYQLEEAGFDALRAYLDTAAARLYGNPDRDEILSDIERAIGEKLRGILNAHKDVVLAKEIETVLAQMGPIEDDSMSGAGTNAASAEAGRAEEATDSTRTADDAGAKPRRLYRIREGKMLAGVCNGIAAYLSLDPTLIRLVFVLLMLFWGTGLLAYIVMAIVIPAAESPEEKAAAFGTPATTQEFIRRAREGYYDAMKSFPDRHARRAWKRRFKQEMRDWRTSFHREAASHAYQWRQTWSTSAAMHPSVGFALPFFSILHGALLALAVIAVVSILGNGTLWGVNLPNSMPAWVALILVFFIYRMLSWPLKAARRSFYYGTSREPSFAWPMLFLVDALVWVGVIVGLVWLANHHFDEARAAVHNLPSVFHEAAQNVRDWWHSK